MKRSVCLRSTLRQPVRTIGITLLCAIAAFAFLYQALQYAVLEDAVDDIAAYYRPIGYLDTGYSLTGGGGIVTGVGALNDVLKDDPYIQYLNNSRATSGVFRELYTADVRGESPQVSSLYVTGTVLSTRLQVNPGGSLQETRFRENGAFLQYSHAVFVSIRPEQYLATLPEYQKADLLTLAFYAKELEPCQALLDNLATGETYLFHLQTNQKIVGEADQFMYRLLPQDTSGALLLPVGAKSTAELLAFLPKETAEDIELLNENHHAAPVITTGDMETSPWMQAYYKLVGGRLLTHEDDASRNPVCVIRQELASIRDVEIGDTIPITLRDLASWETWCGQAGGYIVPENEPLSWKEAATTELELTVVGIVASQHVYQGAGINFSTVFIPDSLLSEEWSSIYQNDRCSFLLRSPEDTAAFLEGVQPVLDQLEIPYPISFEENGWGASRWRRRRWSARPGLMSRCSAVFLCSCWECPCCSTWLPGEGNLASSVH